MINLIEKKQDQQGFSPRANQKVEVNRILHHIDLENRSRNSSLDGIGRQRQQIIRQSNGNSPILQLSQSSPKFQENESHHLAKQFSNSSNSLSNLVVNRSTGVGGGGGGGGVSSSMNSNTINRFNNFQSFSPLQRDSIQEEYYLKNQMMYPNQQYQQNTISISKYTPDKRRLSQSPSPFKISELQTTQFNINSSNLDVKNSRAYLKAMKALQNKVREVENMKQGEIDTLKYSLQEKEDENKSLHQQLNEQKFQIEKLEKKLTKEIDIFNKLENNLKGKLKTVEKENDEYIQHCNFYKSEIESLKEKILSLEQTSKQEMRGLLKEKTQLKDQIHEANNEEQVYQKKIKELQMQNNHLLENIESYELRYRHMEQSFKQQINDSESDIKHSLKQLQFQLLEKDDQIKRLKQDNITLNTDIEITRQKFDEITSQLDEEKRKTQNLDEENKQLSDKIQEIIKDNEHMRSFCQATREMNNKLLSSFSTSRLNDTQQNLQNQTFFKSGSQNQHSFSQSGHNQANQSLNELNHNNINNNNQIVIQEDYLPSQNTKATNRSSSSNLLQTISNVASALPPSQKQILLNENVQQNGQSNIDQLLNKDKYYLNQGLSYSNNQNKREERKQSLPKKDDPIEDNQQHRYSQSQALTSINSQKNIQPYSQFQQSRQEDNNYNFQRQRSFNSKDHLRVQKTLNFSEQKDKNSQETFRTTAQISLNYQDNNQLKSRYEYEQVIQAVLDTEKYLVELNHTYQKLAEDIYNFEGDEIYITVLKKKMLDLKEKIEKKSDFLEEMKARESILAQSFLSHI